MRGKGWEGKRERRKEEGRVHQGREKEERNG